MLEPHRRGDSNKYEQSIFWIKNKKKIYPCQFKFNYIKVGFKLVHVSWASFFFCNWLPLLPFSSFPNRLNPEQHTVSVKISNTLIIVFPSAIL